MIVFSDVGKSYGETVILNDLTFRARRGEKVVIIGPSGSGKTTVLRVLMTLVAPESGEVRIDGKTLWDDSVRALSHKKRERHLRAMRMDVGMVFQQYNLFPNLSVVENTMEALVSVKRLSRDRAREVAFTHLEMVGLADKGESYPRNLSGGQSQRVAIARAIALEPKLVLFDEVTSALDPELVGEVLALLRDLAENSDMTMLFVTHEMRFARDIADTVMMFDHGRIVESGPPSVIFDNPQNPRTADFLSAVM